MTPIAVNQTGPNIVCVCTATKPRINSAVEHIISNEGKWTKHAVEGDRWRYGESSRYRHLLTANTSDQYNRMQCLT